MTQAPSLGCDGVRLGHGAPKVYSSSVMRRCLSRIFSLLVALALVMNGVPVAAGVMSVPTAHAQTALSASTDAAVDDMPSDDCCNDCIPTGGRDHACFAMCVHLPALLAVAPQTQAISTPVFEPTALMAVHDRPIAPDPLPPRPLI
jgi:hypothetical protein